MLTALRGLNYLMLVVGDTKVFWSILILSTLKLSISAIDNFEQYMRITNRLQIQKWCDNKIERNWRILKLYCIPRVNTILAISDEKT